MFDYLKHMMNNLLLINKNIDVIIFQRPDCGHIHTYCFLVKGKLVIYRDKLKTIGNQKKTDV